MFSDRPPWHLQRLIERFREHPVEFFRRPPADKEFFIEQLASWVDRQFQPPHPEIIRARALTMSTRNRIILETEILRFLRNLVFQDQPHLTPPLAMNWFIYRFLRDLAS